MVELVRGRGLGEKGDMGSTTVCSCGESVVLGLCVVCKNEERG